MSADGELHYRSLTEVAALIRAGAVSAVEVARHMLERIAALDPRLHSYALVTEGAALKQAEAADAALRAGGEVGPLHGVPLAVKDLFWTAGVATAAGMPIHRDFVPSTDATVVRRLREAGAVILGKTQMTEGAFAIHHPSIAAPINPWGEALWPGASSSGSGVAVAAGLCFGALGSDTGGSIRFPAAANGLTGLKPSWGRVSRHGAFELAASLDHVGPMARSAADVALLLSVIWGPDPLDPTCWPEPPPVLDAAAGGLAGLRVGVDVDSNAVASDPAIAAMLEAAARTLGELGAELQPVRFPDVRPVVDAWERLAGTEAAVAHADTFPSQAADYGPALSRLLELGHELSGIDCQWIALERMAVRGRLDALFRDVDLLLLPVQPYAAPTLARLGALAEDPEANSRLIHYTSPLNFSGHPAISLPGGFTPQGAPLGFQLAAGRGREPLLCRAGVAFQAATDWHARRPLGL